MISSQVAGAAAYLRAHGIVVRPGVSVNAAIARVHGPAGVERATAPDNLAGGARSWLKSDHGTRRAVLSVHRDGLPVGACVEIHDGRLVIQIVGLRHRPGVGDVLKWR